MRITPDQVKMLGLQRVLTPKKHKYNASSVVVADIKFSSKKEALRYTELKIQERAGLIQNLELQPVFVLQEGFIHQGIKIRPLKYIADFRYEKNCRIVIEDVKGMKTKEYRIKKKLFLKKYPDFCFLEK